MATPRRPSSPKPPAGPRPTAGPNHRARLTGLGIAASVVALAAGGLVAGWRLERHLAERQAPAVGSGDDGETPFFSLRSDGPDLTTPDGVRLHTEVEDPPDRHDVTLVFIHGYALSLDCWHFQRQHFRDRQAELGAKLVFYDQRSHGRSSTSASARCRVRQLADDLAQVLDAVASDEDVPIVLIGHSMGAMTIMELSRRRPDWFDGSGDHHIVAAALIATSAGDIAKHSLLPGVPGPVFARLAPGLLTTLNRIPRLVERGRRANSELGRRVTQQYSFGRDDVPASYVDFMTEMLVGTPMTVVADFYPAFVALDESEAFAVLATIPTVVIGGEKDAITPVEHTRRIITLLPTAESHILPDCGHMGIIEWHEPINAILDGLIERALG